MGGEEITPEIAKEAMRLAQFKLPIKTKFIALGDEEKKAGAKAPAASKAVTVES
jgi:large subunit ribosomal protein L16